MDTANKLDGFANLAVPNLTVVVNNHDAKEIRPAHSESQNESPNETPIPAPLTARLIMRRLDIISLDLRRETVTVNTEFLRHLMTEIARTQRFDPQFYLSAYPDVESAQIAGDITNLQQHYLQAGYFEGRLPHAPAFDAKWYFEHYSDLAGSYSANDEAGLHRHYLDTGLAEGRLGSPQMCGSVWHNG